MRFASLLCLSCSCAIHLAAQPGGVRVPGLGFAWDARSNQIRPIVGIPGAAILGEATANTGFSATVISPRHDLALAVSSSDQRVQVVRLSSGETQDLPGISAAPSRMLFSPSGTGAVVVGSKLQLLTGLAGLVTVQGLDMPPDAGSPGAIAVSDDAQLVLLSATSGDISSTWLLAPGAAPIQLPLPGPIAAAAFRPASRDAVAIGSDGVVYQIGNSVFPADVRRVYAGEERTAGPVAVRVSADGNRAYTANRLGTLAVIDLPAASAYTVACGCAPDTLDPLSATDLFRITDISDHPLMLFDASNSIPRVWFVPADAAPADSKRGGQ